MTPGTDPISEPTPEPARDDDPQKPPRRSRQPVLAAAAILGILLLVLALGVFGGIF